jgi:hypothetical protein
MANVIWANQPLPKDCPGSIFLAGPTPRSAEVNSWRPEALQILDQLDFPGIVFIPEDKTGKWQHSYIQQIEWEEDALAKASCIVFWVPRNLETMPAFTTNIEWGIWQDSGKVVLGAPADAPKMKYLRHNAAKFKVQSSDTLKDTLLNALALIETRNEVNRALDRWNNQTGYAIWEDDDQSKGDGMDVAFKAGWELGKSHE